MILLYTGENNVIMLLVNVTQVTSDNINSVILIIDKWYMKYL